MISVMTPTNYFATLSVELIEQILLQLIRPSDLLSLALTERRMCWIIIPDFLEHCKLEFHICRTEVWEYLNERPLLCSRVKHLNLWNIRGTLKPSLPQAVIFNPVKAPLFPPIDIICSAITKMTTLKKIALNNISPAPFINIGSLFFQQFLALAVAIYRSRSILENIELITFWEDNSSKFDLPPLFMKMLSDTNWLSSVKTFQFHLSSKPSSRGLHRNSVVLKKHLEMILYSMVNLTHLGLAGHSLLPGDPIGMTYRWPKLEFLYLEESINLEAPPDVERNDQYFGLEFIRRHHRLHTVYLKGVTVIQPTYIVNDNEDAVPPLKSFGYLGNIFAGCLKTALPLFMLRNLTHLTFSPTNAQDLRIFDELEMLESCVIQPCAFTSRKGGVRKTVGRMAQGCRNLKKLCIRSSYLYQLPTNDAVFSLFKGLSNLTHLLGISSARRCFPGLEGDTLLRKLYRLFPTLRYVDCVEMLSIQSTQLRYAYAQSQYAYAELQRDNVRQQMEYEIFIVDASGLKSGPCNYKEWGGFNILV